jgi:hypothetical protein
VRYRVATFRELNPQIVADRALVESIEPRPAHALFATFLQACNSAERPRRSTSAIRLEDAFGKSYSPLDTGLDSSLAYAPRRLLPGECQPADDSVAEQSFGAAALVFELPYEATQNRPLVLRIAGPDGDEMARIVLDL